MHPGQCRAGFVEFPLGGDGAVLLDPQAVLEHVALGLADRQAALERCLRFGGDVGRYPLHQRPQRSHALLAAVEQGFHLVGQVEHARERALASRPLALEPPGKEGGRQQHQGAKGQDDGQHGRVREGRGQSAPAPLRPQIVGKPPPRLGFWV